MKKFLIAVCMLMVFITSKGQDYFLTVPENLAMKEKMNSFRKKIFDNHILSIKAYNYKPVNGTASDKKYLSSETVYDKQGNVEEYKMWKKNGKLISHDRDSWDSNNRIIEGTNFRKNGKMKYKETFIYDSNGNMLESRFFWHRPENLTWHSRSKFDENQRRTETTNFGAADKKVYSKYVFSYYSDGSQKQTIQYNGKGKVKHTWNYDCKPAGEMVGVKDTSKICARYETDKDGNKLKIKEEFVRQGSIVRVVNKSDIHDNMLDLVKYDAKGRVRYHYTAKYNDKNNLTEYAVYKKNDKLKYREEYHYDISGNITEVIAYKDDPAPNMIVKFDYAQR